VPVKTALAANTPAVDPVSEIEATTNLLPVFASAPEAASKIEAKTIALAVGVARAVAVSLWLASIVTMTVCAAWVEATSAISAAKATWDVWAEDPDPASEITLLKMLFNVLNTPDVEAASAWEAKNTALADSELAITTPASVTSASKTAPLTPRAAKGELANVA
jgi:hypothetical protein